MLSKLSGDAIGIIATIAGALILHVFYFGRLLGRFETDLRQLTGAFKDFQSQHFITREEYERRHQDLVGVLDKLLGRRMPE